MRAPDYALVAVVVVIVAAVMWVTVASTVGRRVDAPSVVPPASPTAPTAVPHGSWQ